MDIIDIWKDVIYETQVFTRFYSCRIVGGDQHHRTVNRPPAASVGQSQGVGDDNRLRE